MARLMAVDPSNSVARSQLEEIARKTADPQAVAEGLNKLEQTRPAYAADPEKAMLFATLYSGSQFVGNWLVSRLEDMDWLFTDSGLDAPRGRSSMRSHLESLAETHGPMVALRRFRMRELARIATRELTGMAPVPETLREWSAVADIAIDFAINTAEKKALEKHGLPLYTRFEDPVERVGGFACLAMGKLGGEELNISSDVDLIYVHSSDNGTTRGSADGSGKIPLHQYFVQIAREVTRLISETTADGIVFRVDLDLRPEGTKGEITNSVGAMEVYYESWGKQWERQALIKARVCGGSAELGEDTLKRLYPFMYRKYIDQRAIDEIAGMKEKIDLQLKSKKGVKGADKNIKLGSGGIREIEFITQALQLLYGARYPELRARSTLVALDAAVSLGVLSAPHHRDLHDAYVFLRRLENRLQYYQGLQTHSLPDSEERLEVLGRLMGLDSENQAQSLLEETQKRRKRVRGIFDLFFAKPGDDKPTADSFPAPLEDTEAITAWLDSLRFDRPEESAKALYVLRDGKPFTHPSERSMAAFDRFGPAIVSEAKSTPWADNVIFGFERFVEVRGARDMLYELLDEKRSVIKLLSAIFSSSEQLTSVLLRQPDILDRLLASDSVENPVDRYQLADEFMAIASGDRPAEATMAALNMTRSAESLRLGLRRILGLCDRKELMAALTALSEEFLRAVFVTATEPSMRERWEEGWIALAAGKMGRREMNYGSDMDMAIFCDDDEGVKARVTTLVQRVIRLSSLQTANGSGYSVDLRLRPYGEKGELVMPFTAMEEYYRTRADAWERLALVGSRPIAGDVGLGARVMETITEFVTSPPLRHYESAKIASIRERIADEKVKPGSVDIKFGRGGLIEIEFICQWLTLERDGGWDMSPDGEPFTIYTLSRAKREKLLSADHVLELERAYDFYRAIEDALRMDKERAVNAIPSDAQTLRRLARSVNAPGVGPERLVEVVKETMTKVRAIYMEFSAARAGSSFSPAGR